MKERILILVIVCVLGFGACFYAYKNGPLSLFQKNNVAPPGWTPAPQAAPLTPTPPVAPVAPQPKMSPQPRQQPMGPG